MKTIFTTFTLFLVALATSSVATLAQPITDDNGDVAVGANSVDPSAIFDVVATDKGVLAPRMTTAQMNAIPAPASGLYVYNSDQGTFYVWSDASGSFQWDAVVTTGTNTAWLTNGNSNLSDGTNNYLGTNDATPVRVRTNGTDRMVFEAGGDMTASGDIVPSTDNTYSLGSDANRWADVFVDGGTLHIGPSGGDGSNTEGEISYSTGSSTLNANANGGQSELRIGTDLVVVDETLSVIGGAQIGNGIVTGTFTVNQPMNVNDPATFNDDVIYSYASIASGGTVPAGTVVVFVQDNGVGSPATVNLPATGTNGQILIISTNDPQGVTISGATIGPLNVSSLYTRRIVRAGGQWIVEW